MFQDALMESGGKLTTRSRYFSTIGILIHSSILFAMIVWPLLHPLALPKQSLSTPLVAPAPPPAADAPVKASSTPALRLESVTTLFTAPSRIQPSRATVAATQPFDPSPAGLQAMPGGTGAGIGDVLDSTGTRIPPLVVVARPKKLAISSGVMAGNRISGFEPAYPAIARAARIQGTVVLQATISQAGTIENLHVTAGPPMLVSSAVEAVKTWRYRPYLLNGTPVEVETTVNVVFSLGN